MANPLLDAGHWFAVLMSYGLGFGVTAGAFEYEAGMALETWGGEIFRSICAGAIIGFLTALFVVPTLRWLKGRVSPVLGLFLTSMAATLPYLLILMQQDKIHKVDSILPLWALTSVVLVPWTAVRRSRGQNVVWVSMLFGIFAACAIMGLQYIGWSGLLFGIFGPFLNLGLSPAA